MLESRYIEFGPGRQVHAQVGGQGHALVFFPGNGGSLADMQSVMEQLAADHLVVGLDLPGRSETQWPDVRFDFGADLHPVVDWVLSQLGVGLHITIGHGSGALVALHHAQRHFGQVQGVSMLEGYVNVDAQQKTTAKRYRRPLHLDEKQQENFEARRREHGAWLNSHSTFRESFNATQRAYDASKWVGELEIPVQVIVGDQGQDLPAISDSVAWHKQLNVTDVDALEIVLIKDAGYWVTLDQPDTVTKAIGKFVDLVHQDG